jgi:AraC-like DNA-binding protein
MLYLERTPQPALAPFVKSFWYCCDPEAVHRHERVLPTGQAQVVISLARDYLTDANHPTDPLQRTSPAILLGLYTRHQLIDAVDIAELIGIVFQPGGTRPFFRDDANLFTDCETSVEDIWGASFRSFRDHLRELQTPAARFDALEASLLKRLGHTRSEARHPIIDFAIETLNAAPGVTTIAELSRTTGFSTRRLSQLFAQHVGVSPKLYSRIQRFQQTVHQLHRGSDIPWAELALACGYYDQSHFANDFRAFSGISPTTYANSNRPWSNHIALD